MFNSFIQHYKMTFSEYPFMITLTTTMIIVIYWLSAFGTINIISIIPWLMLLQSQLDLIRTDTSSSIMLTIGSLILNSILIIIYV